MKTKNNSHGYYQVRIASPAHQSLLPTNGDRAFIVSQLQDLLSPRLLLHDIAAHRQLASCIDLLAFSITRSEIHLLIFSIDTAIAQYFSRCIASRLQQYRSEQHPSNTRSTPEPIVLVKKLRGPHQALARSIAIHLLHQDWEFDRYSSIGFFLHDRRGDWMRIWRLTQLYDNVPDQYRTLLYGNIPEKASQITTTTQPFAP